MYGVDHWFRICLFTMENRFQLFADAFDLCDDDFRYTTTTDTPGTL